MAYEIVPITQLRDNLGKYAHRVWFHDDRYSIRKGRRPMMALMRARDLDLIREAENRNLDMKAWRVAEELMRYRLIREGIEEFRLEE